MKSVLPLATLLACLAAFASGCVVAVGPGWYYPPPRPATVYVPAPPCPEGYAWVAGVGCSPALPGPPQPAVLARVATPYLNLRVCPGVSCETLAVLNQGEPVEVLGHQEGWAKARSPARRLEGWVSSRYLGQ